VIRLILVGLIGCGTEEMNLRTPGPASINNVNEDFQTHVDSFLYVFTPVYEVPWVKYNELEGDVIGRCYETGGIDVNVKFYADMTIDAQRWLVYHELGHCALGLEHTETGIMMPYLDTRVHVTPEDWDAMVRRMQ
jgi:hypothetical protein